MKESLAVYRRLLGHTRPYAKGFAAAIVGMIVAAATEPLFPALMKPLLDNGFVDKGGIALWVVPTALIAIFVVRGVATFSSNYAMAWVANKVLVDLRRRMFAHMLRLPASEFEREALGLLISRIVFEVTNVTGAATRVLTVIVKDSLVVVGLLGWLFYLNWKLTIVALLLVPATALIIAVYSRRMRTLSRRNLEYTGELTRVVEEAVHGYKVVKVFGAYAHVDGVFERTAEKLRGFAMRMTVAGSATVPVTQLAAAIAVAVVVTIALMQANQDQTTVGGFVSFVTAMLMLLAPLKHLADVNQELQRGLAAAEAVFALLDKAPEADTGSRRIGRTRGEIRFEGVSVRFTGSAQDSITGIDLAVRAGELVALVGSSGAGKTTLVNLLPRFVVPSAGRVTLDGVALEEIGLESLREQIGMVNQEVVLFNESIRGNVAFGVAAAVEDAQIWQALRAAALEEHVRSLPGGLDYVIGERGTRLSGGQRQRLAIARALLKDPPILLLDEATSALDTQTEREVQGALERIMRGRTTLVIAHRLSTVERADRIVVLERGRIAQTGTHAELIAAGGLYATLYRLQFAADGPGAAG